MNDACSLCINDRAFPFPASLLSSLSNITSRRCRQAICVTSGKGFTANCAGFSGGEDTLGRSENLAEYVFLIYKLGLLFLETVAYFEVHRSCAQNNLTDEHIGYCR